MRVRQGLIGIAAALAGSLVVVGCTGGSTGSPAGSPSGSGRSASAPPSSEPATSPASTAPPTSADGAPITLAFAGDVHFATKLAPLLTHPTTALTALRPYLAGADLAMVNLETSITTRGTAQPKEFHFRAPPQAFRAVQSAGIDVVTMANNHAADYGSVGLADTLRAVGHSPIPVVGLGANAAQAYRPRYFTLNGTRVAVLAAMQIPEWTAAHFAAGRDKPGVATAFTPTRLAKAVRAAKRQADVVVVYLHWGTEYSTCPNPLQKSTARALSKAGASVIVGAHAHKLQGAGWLGKTYVDYGLGNFVWWLRQAPDQTWTGVLSLSVQDGHVVKAGFRPMVVSASGLPVVPRAKAERRRLASYWNGLRACTGLSSTPS